MHPTTPRRSQEQQSYPRDYDAQNKPADQRLALHRSTYTRLGTGDQAALNLSVLR